MEAQERQDEKQVDGTLGSAPEARCEARRRFDAIDAKLEAILARLEEQSHHLGVIEKMEKLELKKMGKTENMENVEKEEMESLEVDRLYSLPSQQSPSLQHVSSGSSHCKMGKSRSRNEDNVSFAHDITVIPVSVDKSASASGSFKSLVSLRSSHAAMKRRQQPAQSHHSAELGNVGSRRNSSHSILEMRQGAKSRSIYKSVDVQSWADQLRTEAKKMAHHEGSKRLDVPSMLRMDAAFMRAISTPQPPLAPSSSMCGGSHTSDSAQSLPELDKEQDPTLDSPVTRKDDADTASIVPSLPGAVETSARATTNSMSVKGKVGTVMSLSKDSQANILDQYNEPLSLDVDLNDAVNHDLGSRVMLSFPPALVFILAILSACQCGAVVALLALGYLKGETYKLTMVSTALYTIAAAGGAYFLRRALRSDELLMALGKLRMFVADLELEWSKVSDQEWRRQALTWLFLVLCFAASQAMEEFREGSIVVDAGDLDGEMVLTLRRAIAGLSVVVFSSCSGLVLIAASVLSHILLGLDKSLDCWCCVLLEEADFVLGVQSWNCLQALLKCVGRELASAFLVTQAVGAVGFVYLLANGVTNAFQLGFQLEMLIFELMASLPLLFLFTVNMRVCAHGAALTEKCRQIPAFVNQIPTSEPIDLERSYLVHFISDSSAGFFVKDVRLTREMFLKQFITVGGLLSGFVGVLARMSS